MTTISRGDFSHLRAEHESQHAILENSTVHIRAFRERIACLSLILLGSGAIKDGKAVDKNARKSQKLLTTLEHRFNKELVPAWSKAQNAVAVERDFLDAPSNMSRPGSALSHAKAVELTVKQMESVQNDFKDSFLQACHHLFNTLDQSKIDEVAHMFAALSILEATVCGISEYEMQNCRVQLLLKGYEDNMSDLAASSPHPEVKAAASATASQFFALRATLNQQKQDFLAQDVNGRTMLKVFESAIQRFNATSQKMASGDTSYSEVMVKLAEKHDVSSQIMAAMSDLADMYGAMEDLNKSSVTRLNDLQISAETRMADAVVDSLTTQGGKGSDSDLSAKSADGRLQPKKSGLPRAISERSSADKTARQQTRETGTSASRTQALSIAHQDPAQAFAQASRDLALNLYKACDWLKEDVRDMAQNQAVDTQGLAKDLSSHLSLIEQKIDTQKPQQSEKGLETFKSAILSELEGVEQLIQQHEATQKAGAAERAPSPERASKPSAAELSSVKKSVAELSAAELGQVKTSVAEPSAAELSPVKTSVVKRPELAASKSPAQPMAQSEKPVQPETRLTKNSPASPLERPLAASANIARASGGAEVSSAQPLMAIPASPDESLYLQVTSLVDHLNWTHQQYAEATQQTQGLRQHLLASAMPDHSAWDALYAAEQVLGLAGVELIQQPHRLYIRPYQALNLPATEMIRAIQADWGHPHFNHLNVQGYCAASHNWLNSVNERLGMINQVTWAAFENLSAAAGLRRPA